MRRRRSRGRALNGILLLDKPVGMTSNAALQTVKRLYQANKAGHTGSLDPLASGLLPICMGEATKMSAFLLDADKRYRGVCKLGVRTTTADAEGDVFETRPVVDVNAIRVGEVLRSFTGNIEQIPPMHSAIKYQGQPLYKLAHQGIEVERKPRTVHIYALDLIRLEGDELEIEIHCSKGTYIRTLAEDIGAILGCGAHLLQLRRSEAGPFQLKKAISLADLQQRAEAGMGGIDTLLLPMEMALAGLPAVSLSQNTAFYLRQGQPVLVPQAPTSGWVRLFENDAQFIGVGHILDDGRVAPKRLIGQGPAIP